MGDNTNIAWCDKTYNRWWGCTKVTAACKFCYAEALAKRTGRIPQGYVKGAPRILSKSHNEAMLKRWDREAEEARTTYKVFAHSMSDIFDQEVPDVWRVEEFTWMSQTKRLRYLLLTKRADAPLQFLQEHPEFVQFFKRSVWLGTSLGSDDDIDMAYNIVEAPAWVHWISYEPAIGPLTVSHLPTKISWIVIGGESGEESRRFDLDWANNAIADAASERRRVFMKQLGRNAYLGEARWPTPNDVSHGANPQDWPAWLRVREFPLL